MKKIIVDKNDDRIDNFLLTKLDFSRNKIQKMIKDKDITVNGLPTKSSYKVKESDIIEVAEITVIEGLKKEQMDLDIVYEDDDVIVINKANGVVVHPAFGNESGTLVNGLINYSDSLSTINGELRPGIVHRIDAYTTGLIMIAKNDKAHKILAEQLEAKTTHRLYQALVWGVINNETGTIDAPIGRDLKDRKKMAVTAINSKSAVTHFKVIKRFSKATLIELNLETGRTHQIRVHMNYIGYPIVNDPVYGKRKKINDEGQCLHAKELGFVHPTTKEYMMFTSELPKKITDILNMFDNKQE